MPRTPAPTVDDLRPPTAPLTFLAPTITGETETTTAGDPTTSTSEPTSTSPVDLPDPWSSTGRDEAGDIEDADPSDVPTSSKGSSGKASFGKVATREAARKSVKILGVGAHQLLARDEPAREAGLYLTDDDDDRAIGDPVGSIVHRHGWLGEAANPDVVDGINALIGLGVYAWKQLQRLRQVLAVRAAIRAGTSAAAATGDEPAGGGW